MQIWCLHSPDLGLKSAKSPLALLEVVGEPPKSPPNKSMALVFLADA